jgi:hypothetical protein
MKVAQGSSLKAVRKRGRRGAGKREQQRELICSMYKYACVKHHRVTPLYNKYT